MNSIRPVQEWFSEGPDGIILHDPISHEPIDPNKPPAFIDNDPRIRDGLDLIRYTHSNQASTNVMFFTHPYPRSASHLGPAIGKPGHESYEELLSVDVTSVGYAIDNTEPNNEALRIRQISNGIERGTHGLTAFHARLLGGIAARNHPSFAFGMQVTPDQQSFTTQAGASIAEMRRMIHELPPEDNTSMARQSANVIVDNAWQWHAAGLIGEGLVRAKDVNINMEQRPEYNGHEVSMLVTPTRHLDLGRKLNILGLPDMNECLAVETSEDIVGSDQNFTEKAMRQGYIAYNDLEGF